MDKKAFNDYLQDANRELNSKGIVNSTNSQLYELALQRIKEKYDSIIEDEFEKRRKLVKGYIDDLECRLKSYVDKDLFEKLQTVVHKELKSIKQNTQSL